MTTTLGTGGALVIGTDPEFRGDLQAVTDQAALMGGYRRGTNAARLALTTAEKFDGLAWLETDTGLYLIRISGAWVSVLRVMSTSSWQFGRVSANPSDTFGAGALASLAGGTITAAPAGRYLIGCSASLVGTVASSGNLRLMADASNISADAQQGVAVKPNLISFDAIFSWGGGNLVLSLGYLLAEGGGQVNKNGTLIRITYLGP